MATWTDDTQTLLFRKIQTACHNMSGLMSPTIQAAAKDNLVNHLAPLFNRFIAGERSDALAAAVEAANPLMLWQP